MHVIPRPHAELGSTSPSRRACRWPTPQPELRVYLLVRGPAAAVRRLPGHADPGPRLPAVRGRARADRRGRARRWPSSGSSTWRCASVPDGRARASSSSSASSACWRCTRRDLADVERAGEAILRRASAPTPADQLRPRVLFHDVIEDITDQHAVIINRNREASMIMPGETLLRLRDDPGAVRGRRRQRGRARRPGLTLVDVLDDRRGRPGLPRGRHRGRSCRARDEIAACSSRREAASTVPWRARPDGERATAGPDRRRALAALRRSTGAHGVTLCNVSENATYLVDDPATGPYALRVHRPGYHTGTRSPRSWPWLRRAARGRRGATRRRWWRPRTASASSTVRTRAATRNVVLFECLPGTEPPEPDGADLIAGFRTLGAVTARMHAHARAWRPPGGVRPLPLGLRRTRSAPAATGARWQDGIGVGPAERAHARPARRHAARRLDALRHRAERGSAWSTPTSGWPTCWSTAADGARHRLRRLRLLLVPVRLRHGGVASSSTTRACPSWRPPGSRATARCRRCPPRTRPSWTRS